MKFFVKNKKNMIFLAYAPKTRSNNIHVFQSNNIHTSLRNNALDEKIFLKKKVREEKKSLLFFGKCLTLIII